MSFYFAAEKTLGKLAKWLRLLGFDTSFESEISSDKFFEHLQPERILLTRTKWVRENYSSHRHIFIESNNPRDQLKQVIRELGICQNETRPFSRCLSCNVEITEVPKNAVYGKVPDYIWETNDVFQTCPTCKRNYWPGSHTKRSMQQIEELFK
ncbi:MAG: Mut7-C RNAse domain-containing protein [Desulfobacterales bacterium]|nr:MAG: Mut7-C RNAse domain-containing protein [Desulfobacterales bacterium]